MKTLLNYLAFTLALVLWSGALPSVSAQEDTEESIRQQMLERVDQIDALKLSGKVGENNEGLLEQRGQLSPEERTLMNEENADRRALYTSIAKRLGLTMTVVGRERAEDLRKKSANGVWLQDRSGEWYKKS